MATPTVGQTFLESVATFLGFNEPSPPVAVVQAPDLVVNTIPKRAPRNPLTPADEAIQEMTTSIKDTTRELNRELNRMKRAENTNIRDIRAAAEKGAKAEAVRIARGMVTNRRAQLRLKRAVDRMEQMKGRLQTQRANARVHVYYKKSVEIMQQLNAFTQPETIQALAHAMSEASEKYVLGQETMDEALDELDEADAAALGEDAALDDNLSSDLIVEQIFTECGLEASDMMPAVPAKAPSPTAATAIDKSDADAKEKEGEVDGGGGGAPTISRTNTANHDDADEELAARLRRLQGKK